MSLAQLFSEVLRQELERAGVTPKEFANLAHTTVTHLNMILAGKATARYDTLDEWATQLGFVWKVGAEDPEARKALATLVNHGLGRTKHRNQGQCPDGVTNRKARDPKCRVCVAIDQVKTVSP